jgi:hypothetical protein
MKTYIHYYFVYNYQCSVVTMVMQMCPHVSLCRHFLNCFSDFSYYSQKAQCLMQRPHLPLTFVILKFLKEGVWFMTTSHKTECIVKKTVSHTSHKTPFG